MAKILIADDEPAIVSVLSEVLRELRHEVFPANSAERAWALFQEHQPDLVLTDIEMPQGKPTGLELLRQIKETNGAIPVLVITGQGTKERAVAALRGGAQDFVEKPFQIDELLKRVDNALFQAKASHALRENAELKIQLREKFRFENIIGSSPPMEAVYRMIERVADTDSTVLILGESGTGKELVAKALHYNSRRANLPFVAVNCAALPEHLLESELFGHRKGAFTGAAFDKVGLFQDADGGTIFLDEIGSMPLGLQSKLLRFLQDKELRRVGYTQMIKVDVRVIAATNERLQEKLKEKHFREDLYYRISVIPIELPPLRDRVEDVPLLVTYTNQIISQRMGRLPPRVPEDVMEAMKAYHWPGNVRELKNVIERACALCDGGVIELRDMPAKLLEAVATTPAAATRAAPAKTAGEAWSDKLAGAAQTAPNSTPVPLKEFLHEQEVRHIERAIRIAEGNKEKAAEILGISMATLYRKLSPGDDGPDSNPA